MRGHVCHSMYEEVRGQLCGVGSLSPSTWTRVSGCHTWSAKCPYPSSNSLTSAFALLYKTRSPTETLFYQLGYAGQWASGSSCLQHSKLRHSCLCSHLLSPRLTSVEFLYIAMYQHWHALFHCTGHYTLVTHSSGRGHFETVILLLLMHAFLSFRYTQE